MFREGDEGPVFLSIDDPLVIRAAKQWSENAVNLSSYQAMGRKRVLVGQEPESGDYIIMRAKEIEEMDKSVFWGIRNAKEKLKSVYMDLDEMPEVAGEVKIMAKRLEEIERLVDEKVN